MSRPALLLAVFGLVYATLLVLFSFVIADGNVGITWALWLLCGAIALSCTASELALLLCWLYRKASGKLSDEPYVSAKLTDQDRIELAKSAPGVAMLMPAHKEVSTPEDSEAFITRIVDMLCRTPSYSSFFLLFDSPADQHQNELAAVEEIKARLREKGRHADTARLRMETYRDKPAALKNKPGSIQLWIERHCDKFEFMFVLDADSSLPEEDPARPVTCDVLARLVLAMQRHPELAMIQAAIEVHTAPTLWGWVQSVGVGMASRYHGRLFQWLLEGGVPSYGHNVLFRVSDFVTHVKNTLEYLSHDFLDAADLTTAGRKCVQTYAVTTCEEGEASLLGYLLRDLRWARGNAQWANYWFTKPGLALAPRIYLAIGILCYVWPLMASLVLLSSVFLLGAGMELFSASHTWAIQALIACVFVSLVMPKALAAGSIAKFNGSILIGTLVSPSLTLVQGLLFLLGAFGTKWTMRAPRTAKLDLEHAKGILRLFLPVSFLGLVLWTFFLPSVNTTTIGESLIRIHLTLLIVSPAVALMLSYPLPEAWLYPPAHVRREPQSFCGASGAGTVISHAENARVG